MKKVHTGDRVRAARQLKKLSQDQLAALIVMSRSSISNYELKGNIPQEVLKLIWEKLDTTEERIEEIMNGGVHEPEKDYENILEENKKLRQENSRLTTTIAHLNERIQTLEKAMGLKHVQQNKSRKKR